MDQQFTVGGFLTIEPVTGSGIGELIIDFLLANPNSTGLEIANGVINPVSGVRFRTHVIRHFIGFLVRTKRIEIVDTGTGSMTNTYATGGAPPLFFTKFDVDAILLSLVKEFAFTVDAKLNRVDEFLVDAVIKAVGQTLNFTVDSIVLFMPAIPICVDAILEPEMQLTEVISESPKLVTPKNVTQTISESPTVVIT